MTASIYPTLTDPAAAGHAWVDVDLDAVRHNAAQLHARAGVPLIAMVKADGYGLGAVPISRALGASFADSPPADGTDLAGSPLLWGLGVATVSEARALRDAGCTARILCCTPLLAGEFAEAIALRLRPALHVESDIVTWASIGGGAWHLSVDTGIARAGVRWDEVGPLRKVLPHHRPEGVLTHFQSAEQEDGSRELQDERFRVVCAALADVLPASVLAHSDNSAAIAVRGRSDASLVRPGIALYGAQQHPTLDLRQVVHLRARIVDIRLVNAGESVGYGATWTATETRRIATVPVGYADGYRRHLSNRGQAMVHGARVPVVGRISMDMTTLDVTDVSCAVGDVVTLLGGEAGRPVEAGMTTDAVAARAELSPYELLVGLRLRLPRAYVGHSFGGGT